MMHDREKVIKGLEICYCPHAKCEDCPYHDLPDEESCNDTLCLDALALLKEQEPIKPITEHKLFLCPMCKNTLFREQKFCHECGKRIEWEGR